jgi:hypothetical protein
VHLGYCSVAAERLNKIGKDSTIIQRTSSSNRLAEESGSLHGQAVEEIADLHAAGHEHIGLVPPSSHWRRPIDPSDLHSPTELLQNLSAVFKSPGLIHQVERMECAKPTGPNQIYDRSNDKCKSLDQRNRHSMPHPDKNWKALTPSHIAGPDDHSDDVIITLNDSKYYGSAHQVLLPKQFNHSSTAF